MKKLRTKNDKEKEKLQRERGIVEGIERWPYSKFKHMKYMHKTCK